MCTWNTGSVYINAQVPTDQVNWLDDRIRLLEHSSMHRPTSQPTGGPIPNGVFEGSMPRTAGVRRASRSCWPDPLAQPSATSLPCDGSLSTAPSRTRPYLQPMISATSAVPGVNSQRQEASGRADDVSPSDGHSVHAIIGATLDEDQREGFFGSSSAGTFMQNVKKMVEQKLGKAQQSMPPALSRKRDSLPLLVSGHDFRHKQVDYVLPPRKKADRLMAAYWEYVHVLYPYLDRAQVQEGYDNIWRGDGSVSDERSFLCLLNIIFALSSQIVGSTALEERERSATVFYLRARELLDVVETGSVRSVQSFLLLGQYFQSTNEPHPCWVFVGLGIRAAQSLGLHLPETSERVSDIRTRETLRKVWHGCILMDRVLSMTYGRLCMIGPRTAIAVPLPLAIDEERLLPDPVLQHTVQAQRPSVIDFYISSLRLYEILHDVLFNFYAIDIQQSRPVDGLYDKYFGRSSSTEGHPSVFELERRLSRWENSIPDHLKIGNYPRGDGAEVVLYRQAVILHQR